MHWIAVEFRIGMRSYRAYVLTFNSVLKSKLRGCLAKGIRAQIP